jgi:hypothetical protein
MGTQMRVRDRIGWRLMCSLSSIQPAVSWSARMWHPQEQKKRPKISVATITTAISTKPAVTIP